MLSARWPGSDVPGMTSTCGPRCRAHDRRTCAGVAWCSRATVRTCSGSAPLGPASRPAPAMAKNGTNVTPCSPQARRSLSCPGVMAEAVGVLYAYHRRDLLGLGQVLRAGVGHPEVADQAGVAQF